MREMKIKKGISSAEAWRELAEGASLSDEELKKKLQDIHRTNLPSFAEIIINSGCMNQCKHCIYPEDYAR